jgi:hypothetical protein
MKSLTLLVFVVIGALTLPSTRGQDLPGLAIGGFVEQRTDNKIYDEKLSFTYYGVRLKIRDEQFLEGFLDLGIQSMDLGSITVDDTGSFGLGGTLWLLRAEDLVIPMDIGAFGSYHIADYTLTSAAGSESDAKYGRFMVQAVIRAEGYGSMRPYLRAGVMGSNLDPDNERVVSGEDLNKSMPAINVGAEISVYDRLVLTLEGNYGESVGGVVHFDYWF